jgi:hypothetical protein
MALYFAWIYVRAPNFSRFRAGNVSACHTGINEVLRPVPSRLDGSTHQNEGSTD